MGGALDGVRVVDLSRLAPGPFCSMMLGDFGADVLLVEPPATTFREAGSPAPWELERDEQLYAFDGLRRNKRSIALNLKDAREHALFLELVRDADVVLEGFRPGVVERLGIGFEHCRAVNPGIVYCSIAGFDPDGPDAQRAGHDINYLAEAGVLGALGTEPEGRPAIPMNLIADFAGGGMFAAFSIAAALLHRERTGRGQQITISMTDAALSLMTYMGGLLLARGMAPEPRRFFLSGGLPYYDCYQARDGRWIAVGALELWFFRELCAVTGRPDLERAHGQPAEFQEVARHLTQWFGARSTEEVVEAFAGRDACVSPVLSLAEALERATERGMVVPVGEARQVGPAPRLSTTPPGVRTPPPRPDEHGREIRAQMQRAPAVR